MGRARILSLYMTADRTNEVAVYICIGTRCTMVCVPIYDVTFVYAVVVSGPKISRKVSQVAAKPMQTHQCISICVYIYT